MTELDLQRVLDGVLRNDFLAFLQKCFGEIGGGALYLENWHIEAIAHWLDRVECGEINRLIVTLPPRNLKSIMISVAYVAWLLGHDPTLRIICVSYSYELAMKHARDCRQIIESAWYRRIFPRSRISPARNAGHDFDMTAGGGRLSTSVGGTLTGRGGDMIIIDDPMKPEDAMSETARANLKEWYGSTLYSRLNNKETGAIILVMQRLHEDDLAGFLLSTSGWEQLRLPAIAQEDERIPLGSGRYHIRREGEALHPAREPLNLLASLKASIGSMVFAAQYLQQPIPKEGLFVKREWLLVYRQLPEGGDIEILQSWDTASKDGLHNDLSACVTALRHKNRVYVIDVFAERLTFPQLKHKVIELARRYGARRLFIEDAASGTQLIQVLKEECPQGVPRPIACTPTGDKQTRFSAQTHHMEAGQLLLPADAPWLDGYITQLIGFPNATHDDQADATAQLLANAFRRKVDSVGGAPILFVEGKDETGEPRWISSDSPEYEAIDRINRMWGL